MKTSMAWWSWIALARLYSRANKGMRCRKHKRLHSQIPLFSVRFGMNR